MIKSSLKSGISFIESEGIDDNNDNIWLELWLKDDDSSVIWSWISDKSRNDLRLYIVKICWYDGNDNNNEDIGDNGDDEGSKLIWKWTSTGDCNEAASNAIGCGIRSGLKIPLIQNCAVFGKSLKSPP